MNHLKRILGKIVHQGQSYCIPGCSTFDGLFLMRDMMDLIKMYRLDVGLISLDQEKAFDKVDHHYLFKMLADFRLGPFFIVRTDVYNMLRINGTLMRPFTVSRGIRQGGSLSGILYTLAIELF